MIFSKHGLPGLAISVAIAGSNPSFAQTQTQENPRLQEIVVSSSRIATPLRQVGTSVSVVQKQEILSKGHLSLFDVLRSQPSVAVSNSGGPGQPTTLRIRGEEGFRTITLLDGMKISDPSITQVQPQLEHTLSHDIERVEILRGPQAFSYGADAGGLINIHTTKGEQGFDAGIDVQGGSLGTRQLAADAGGGNDRLDFHVSAASYETDGFNNLRADDVLRDKDDYENETLHGRLGFNLSDALTLGLVHRQVAGQTGYDNCFDSLSFSTVHDCDSEYTQEATRLSADLETAHARHSLGWSQTRTDRDFFSLGNPAFAASGEISRIEYLGDTSLIPGARIVFGVDAEEEVNNDTSRDQMGYYLEYLSDFSDRFYVTAGVRQDDNDDFGEHTSYRLTGAWLIRLQSAGTVKLRANYGTGFRAPSLYEIAYNTGPWATPPASLTPLKEEESRGYEAAVAWYGNEGASVELVYFDQKIQDAILFDLALYSGYLQDVGTSTSEGIELSGEYPLTANLSLSGNYTFNETRRPDGQQRQRRPEQLFNLGLSWQLDRLSLNAFARASRDAVDQVGSDVVALEDSEVLDLGARYRFSDKVELYARIENLGDSDHEEIAGYNNAGRTAYIGARLHF